MRTDTNFLEHVFEVEQDGELDSVLIDIFHMMISTKHRHSCYEQREINLQRSSEINKRGAAYGDEFNW